MNIEDGIIMEFFNSRLISQVPLHLQKKEPVIITGDAGTGKTTLLRFIANNFSKDFKAVYEFKGMQLRRGKEMDQLYLRASKSKGGLVVIDGLDEILDKDALEEVLYILRTEKI